MSGTRPQPSGGRSGQPARRTGPAGRSRQPVRRTGLAGRSLAAQPRPVASARRAPVRRRRSRRVYVRRRIAALILVAAIVAVAAVVVDKAVRAVLPASKQPTVTGLATDHPRRTTAPTTPTPTTPATLASGAPVGRNPVSISAVGDTELGTTGTLPPHPARYLDGVRSVLAVPIVFANLEATLGTGTKSQCPAGSKSCLALQDPPVYARYLRSDGFNVLSSANNHSHDYGDSGVNQTSAALQAAGIVQAGLPDQIGLVSDGSTKVAFAAFAPYATTNDLLDLRAAKALIVRAESLAPVVIVYMHAGAEGATADRVTGNEETYLGEDRGNPKAFAEAAIDDGASAVIASGPHVLRGMEFYKGHLIAYSLGDFAGYKSFSTAGDLDLSGILHLTLSPSGAFVRGAWTSLLLDSAGAPAVDPTGASARFVNELSVADFGSEAAVIGTDGSIAEPASG